MKLYIAGPMTGLPEYNYPAFHIAEKRLYQAGYDVLNPANNEDHNNGEKFSKEKLWYMRRALRMVTEVDGIALLPGWEESEGVAQELQVASMLGVTVKPIGDWLI